MSRAAAIGAAPDVLCFGKGLGGGLPISACVAPEAIMRAWARDADVVHTSTHSGSPLACAAAAATLDALAAGDLCRRSIEVGERFQAAVRGAVSGCPGVVAVRGAGLMVGVELERGELGLRAMRGMLAEGYLVLTGGVRGETLTLTPPLTVREDLLAGAAAALSRVLAA